MLQLETYLKERINTALQKRHFPQSDYQFDRPKLAKHGDISVNLAMILAKLLKQNPRQVAEEIVDQLDLDSQRIEKIEIAGPGFINFFIAKPELHNAVSKILESGNDYGKFDIGASKKAMVEFVSANPTGPLTVGHGRQAVIGDTIANLYEWLGYEVTREYYFNNAGRQMRVLAESVKLRYLELLGHKIQFPEDYYQGQYIQNIAVKIGEEYGESLEKSEDLTIFKQTAEEEIFKDIKKTLATLQVYFDSFFNELDLYESGEIEKTIEELKNKGLAYEKEGALWFKTTAFGQDQDRVIVKSSGEPTYRLPDIAYHKNKFDRKFDLLIDLFGADHISTYPDVLAGLEALGYSSEPVKVLLHQFVTLIEGDEKIKMSTRKATFVTLDELIEEVGADVTRWFFLMRSLQTHLNFDLKLAKTQSDENPVFYNQYAHARICSILRNAEQQSIQFNDDSQFHRLQEDSESELILKLMEFPKTIYNCAFEYEPHLLPLYLSDVSTAFHKFYTECRVLTDDPNLTQARLGLCMVTKTVLANGFNILGVSAPEQM